MENSKCEAKNDGNEAGEPRRLGLRMNEMDGRRARMEANQPRRRRREASDARRQAETGRENHSPQSRSHCPLTHGGRADNHCARLTLERRTNDAVRHR